MDSITQGILGAAAAQAVMARRLPRGAGLPFGVGWIGAIGGMVADLDVFIRSSTDPTVSWVYHRHFTHSLFFIPIGGLLAALPFLFLQRYKERKRDVILASSIGYATHAPLDMFTNYGTQLFWPLTNTRVAVDWIGIVDPVYTIPLWIGVLWTARSRNPRFVRIALLLTTLYIGFGGWQHHRAAQTQQWLMSSRGHVASHARVMPAPGWLLLWRSVYLADDKIYVDAIRVPWIGAPRIREGGVAATARFETLPAAARQNPESVRRFWILNWFADGLLAPIPESPLAIGDMRITPFVEGLQPLWGLQFDPATGAASSWRPTGDLTRGYGDLIRSLFGADEGYEEVGRRQRQ